MFIGRGLRRNIRVLMRGLFAVSTKGGWGYFRTIVDTRAIKAEVIKELGARVLVKSIL